MASHIVEKAQKSGASDEQVKYLKQMEENRKAEEDAQFQEAMDDYYDDINEYPCTCDDPGCSYK